MKPSTAPPADPAILEALRLRARGQAALGFADFMDVALYDPGAGYYRRGGPRIGYGPGTDFLTASASAPLFGRLVVAACTRLLGTAAAESEFVEVGAEGGAGILRGIAHPLRSGGGGGDGGAAPDRGARGRLLKRALRRAAVPPVPLPRRQVARARRLDRRQRPLGGGDRRRGAARGPAPGFRPGGLRDRRAACGCGAGTAAGRAALVGPLSRFRLREILAGDRVRDPGGHGSDVPGPCPGKRPPGFPRQAGPHLPCLLGLARRRPAAPRLRRSLRRVPGGLLHPSLRGAHRLRSRRRGRQDEPREALASPVAPSGQHGPEVPGPLGRAAGRARAAGRLNWPCVAIARPPNVFPLTRRIPPCPKSALSQVAIPTWGTSSTARASRRRAAGSACT